MALTPLDQAKRIARHTEELVHRSLAAVGAKQSERRISADAQDYWRRDAGDRWRANSHWRDASAFRENDLWPAIGREHLELFERGARMTGFTRPWDRIVDWGCGGGANAVAFAPRARQYVGVDISADTLGECERQVAGACGTPFTPVSIDVDAPEAALEQITEPCDVFLCFYVFELIPTPEYGERLLRIASRLLAPGGLALIQVKYDPGGWWTRPRRRAYRSGLAEMTTYPIAAFWELAERCGLKPETVQLVPRNALDWHYAYFLLSRP
ncbi:class I SAM-dependent methyltransferase [Amycolatopsis sp. NPDC049252]|uniref:class I SAM-dependent methyltransferase n=1 Tax=Amycolatopsis sp. NPDC049252 TaxID=3363933 RepID=UPI003717B899